MSKRAHEFVLGVLTTLLAIVVIGFILPEHSDTSRADAIASDEWVVFGIKARATDWLLVAFTSLLAVATLALWRSTSALVSAAEKTARSQLRAYVGVVDIQLETCEPDKRPDCDIHFKNFGQTPAMHLIKAIEVEVHDDPPTAPFGSLSFGVRSILHPSDTTTTTVEANDPLSADDLEHIKAGRKMIYAFGEIRYRDVFGQSHSTKFRLMHGGPRTQEKLFTICPEGNDAD